MSAFVSCADEDASSVGSASSSGKESAVRCAMYGCASGEDNDAERVSLEEEARISGSVCSSSSDMMFASSAMRRVLRLSLRQVGERCVSGAPDARSREVGTRRRPRS